MSGAEPPNAAGGKRGLMVFGGVLAGLLLLNLLLGVLVVPAPALAATQLALLLVFVIAPIYGLFRASEFRYTPRTALLVLITGVVMQAGLTIVARNMLRGTGFPEALAVALAQTGLLVWCLGLGALLTSLIKDRNLFVPIFVFLICFDIFLVLTPLGFTQQMLQAQPQVYETISYAVPKAQPVPTEPSAPPPFGPVAPWAFVGPADLLFLAMLFTALFRFGLRTRQTLLWMAPTLVLYMGLVLVVGPMPALVPIGLVALLVNLREFKLSRDELASTVVIGVLGIAMVAYGLTRSRPPAETAPKASVPDASAPAAKPAPAPPYSPRS